MSEFKPFQEERPWGNFRQFTHNSLSTVKIIFVKKGEAFSLQYHNHRTEFWKVLSGTPEITLGESIINAKFGDEFVILPKTNHRVYAASTDAEILEISSGDFDENDIVRIEDKYGRA
ncbi:mannose-6-phosphate isomerase [Candidatus Nomurabacteria bacterium RIFCSPLOWO2_01_FULL_42_17]|uniref:Mannose-6-phosphate isomerase n=1 Tax=Candidatus Nomurabacteria bacterium RIFCSPLOWO2_01_FULL_42_17 TaxID=1801780 RepID=A0A1F6XNN9_9BACT|nr:MAG: mannose-6-phosphate isomerase [Candidatus Nomurabacteria bacterium RIFCSPLOWO2_01_FULL_42_17]